MALPFLLGPALGAFLVSLLSWVFRKVVITFFIVTAIYILIDFLGPLVVRLAGTYFNANPMTILNGVPDSVWWFAAAFKVDFGVKVLFSALATRFLIRRIPFIG